MPRNALGRGLGALIREPEAQPPATPPATTGATGTAAATARETAPSGTRLLDIDLIDPSPYQPRTRFRAEALDELARSIRASGIIQPLIVRPIGNRFQLIAGERRWRAAQRAGLTKVPVIVRQVADNLALEMTLVENIQREDLNAIEAARAFERLMDEAQLTQEAVAERTGKDRATIANAIRLLKLEPKIQDWIEEGKLTAGTAAPCWQCQTRNCACATRNELRAVDLPCGRSNDWRPAARAAAMHRQKLTWTRIFVRPSMSFNGTSVPRCFSTRKQKSARGSLCLSFTMTLSLWASTIV